MSGRTIARFVTVTATVVAALGVATTVALAADNNHNGQIDYGDTGDAVKCVQHVVHTYAHFGIGGNEDGIFGPGTRQGVRNYQSMEGLGVDGQVGPITGHDMRVFVNELHHQAILDGNNSLRDDTQNWLNTCPRISSLFN